MRHRTTTKTYGPWLKLVKKTNPKTGRRHYSVIADAYQYSGWISGQVTRERLTDLHEAWRDHFDPNRNRGMKLALSWKFSNKTEAEQLITVALLKWGERDEISLGNDV